MLRNFLFNVAGVTGSFTLQSREAECLESIRTTVGTHKVLVSGRGGRLGGSRCVNSCMVALRDGWL